MVASASAAPELGPNASGTFSCTYKLASPCEMWTETGKSVLVRYFDLRYPQADDEFSFILEPDRLVLDFSDSQTFIKCGLGAELPERVVIVPADPQCRVEH